LLFALGDVAVAELVMLTLVCVVYKASRIS